MTNQNLKAAWTDVGDELSALGLKLKLHVEQEWADEKDDIDGALDRLAAAVDAVADASGNAAQDEAVRADVASAGHSIIAALSATVHEVKTRR